MIVRIKKIKINYKIIGDHKLNLYIFFKKPKKDEAIKLTPCIIFFHGGGWTGGSVKQFFPQCKYLARQVYITITAEYRVNSIHNTTPFECVEDFKSAIRWVRKNAKAFSIDTDKIIASGGSAGGHIALCTAFIEDNSAIDEKAIDENFNFDSKPNAVVAFNPVVDTLEHRKNFEKQRKLFNGRELELSVSEHAEKIEVPILLFHGTDDTTVPYDSVEEFANKMKNLGKDCELVTFDRKGHGFFNYHNDHHRSFNETMQKMKEFLNKLDLSGK